MLPSLEPLTLRLTGLPSDDQTLPRRTKLGRTVEAFALFLGGAFCGVGALGLAGPAALLLAPIGAGVMIAGARDLQLSILHHAAHNNVFPRTPETSGAVCPGAMLVAARAVDRIVRLGEGGPGGLERGRAKVRPENRGLGSLIATMLLLPPFDEYVIAHTEKHHGRQSLSTCDDDTMVTLKEIGVKGGRPVGENCKRFLLALISPAVHGRILRRRLRGQLLRGTPGQRLMAWSYVGAVGSFAAATGWWMPVLVGFVLPITVGYQVAQIARFVVEHSWPDASETLGARTAATHDELTVAVRCAVPPPVRWTAASTFKWSGDMALNVAVRCMVLPGDSGPSHAWHHGEARGDWANHFACAQIWERERLAKGLPPMREAWGYREALRVSLESFSKAKAEDCRRKDAP